MADCSDVETAIVLAVTQAVYPNGTGNPSVANTDCKIYRGWPVPKNLDADLVAGNINITVFPQDNETPISKYPREEQTLASPTPSLTLTAAGLTVTASGTVSSPLNAAVLVNGAAYVYAVQPSDTLTSVATGLAALINVRTPATSSGAVITIPAAKQLVARVGGFGTVIRETKRQKRGFMVTCWCPTPALRDIIAPAIDKALAAVDYLSLPDGTGGRIIYQRTRVSDRAEKEWLYRRDLFYSVEYGTTDTTSVAQIVTELLNVTDSLTPPTPIT